MHPVILGDVLLPTVFGRHSILYIYIYFFSNLSIMVIPEFTRISQIGLRLIRAKGWVPDNQRMRICPLMCFLLANLRTLVIHKSVLPAGVPVMTKKKV